MTIRESIEIERPPSEVWPFVEDPEQRMRWNRKLKQATLLTGGARGKGSRFAMVYMISGKENRCTAEVVEFDPPTRLRLKFSEDQRVQGIKAVEDYRLTPTAGGTLVEQEVVVEMKLNPLLRLLIWFLTRFGRPVGEPQLAVLKRMVEGA